MTFSSILYYDVKEHGLASLVNWVYTQDNWVLSLLPYDFLLFHLFGVNQLTIVISGWLIFVFSAFVSGLIAFNLGAKMAAIGIVIALLFLGEFAHSYGFVSYPISHNITNLYGLLSVLAFVLWVKSGKWFYLILLQLLLICGSISDPWMNATYVLPIFILSLRLLVIPTLHLTQIKKKFLIILTIVSIIAIKSKLFGLLYWLPSMSFSLVNFSIIKSNVLFFITNFGTLFNIVPAANPANTFLIPLISTVAVIILFVSSIRCYSFKNTPEDRTVSIFTQLVIYSVVIVSLAFVLTGSQIYIGSSRFLINCLYLLVILIAIMFDLGWKKYLPLLRIIFVLIAAMFTLTGSYSIYKLATNGNPTSSDEASEKIQFLKSNNLNYGYAPYWSGTYDIKIKSNNQIKIIPVMFDKIHGSIIVNRAQTKNTWFTSSDDSHSNQKNFFVLLRSDAEECADINICKNGVVEQFGKPDKILKFKDSLIYVWNYSLFDSNHKIIPSTNIKILHPQNILTILINILLGLTLSFIFASMVLFFILNQRICNYFTKMRISDIYNSKYIKYLSVLYIVIAILTGFLLSFSISYLRINLSNEARNTLSLPSVYYSLKYTPRLLEFSNMTVDDMGKQKLYINSIDFVSSTGSVIFSKTINQKTRLIDLFSPQKSNLIQVSTNKPDHKLNLLTQGFWMLAISLGVFAIFEVIMFACIIGLKLLFAKLLNPER